jgi:membrane protease YdiL (CAAX protease family)
MKIINELKKVFFDKINAKTNIQSINISIKEIIHILILATAIQTFGTMILQLLYLLEVDSIKIYFEYVENFDIETSLFYRIFYTPILEEIYLRFVILKIFFIQLMELSFFVANIIQSMIFAVMHGNIVQVFYSSLFGILV